ncbi:hypothetical protein GJ698_23820 [Pseudoduganella sp. FT26W]|uniref:Uncharacterized protein n=1 Tax=Duganella aquatilis TaxID=2666082 RepID=A0A844D843_9BURK|nr:hypothetical protein [Duganella aquatilis]MRW87101.1 hypothetical protein [Duganella aquatilis]
MARDTYAYRQMVVESVDWNGRVEIHPASGQAYATDLPVQCSRRLSDTSVYPLGTCFLVNAKLTDRDGVQYLYVWHGDEVKVMSDAEADVFLGAYRRVRL